MKFRRRENGSNEFGCYIEGGQQRELPSGGKQWKEELGKCIYLRISFTYSMGEKNFHLCPLLQIFLCSIFMTDTFGGSGFFLGSADKSHF